MTLFGLHGDLHSLSLTRFKMQGWIGWIGRVRIEPILITLGGYSKEDVEERANRNFPAAFVGLREICQAGCSSAAAIGTNRPDHKAVDGFAGDAVAYDKYQHGWFRPHLQPNMGSGVRCGQDDRLLVWAGVVMPVT